MLCIVDRNRTTTTDSEVASREGEDGVCVLELNPLYAVLSSTISFYLPCLAMLCIYYRLHRYARKQVETIKMTYRSSLGRPSPVADDDGDSTTNPLRDKMSDHKAAITLGIIMGVFLMSWNPFHLHLGGLKRPIIFVGGLKKSQLVCGMEWSPHRRHHHECVPAVMESVLLMGDLKGPGFVCGPSWSPFFTVNLVGALCGPGCVPPLVFAVFTWLGYVNSTMNPVIYSIFNREFRDAFRRVLAAARRCGHRDTGLGTTAARYGAVRARASASTAYGEFVATLEDPAAATRARSSLNAASPLRQTSTRI